MRKGFGLGKLAFGSVGLGGLHLLGSLVFSWASNATGFAYAEHSSLLQDHNCDRDHTYGASNATGVAYAELSR